MFLLFGWDNPKIGDFHRFDRALSVPPKGWDKLTGQDGQLTKSISLRSMVAYFVPPVDLKRRLSRGAFIPSGRPRRSGLGGALAPAENDFTATSGIGVTCCHPLGYDASEEVKVLESSRGTSAEKLLRKRR